MICGKMWRWPRTSGREIAFSISMDRMCGEESYRMCRVEVHMPCTMEIYLIFGMICSGATVHTPCGGVVETMMTAIIILHDHMGRHNPNSIVIVMVAMVMTMILMLAIIPTILVPMILAMIIIMMMPQKEIPYNLRGDPP